MITFVVIAAVVMDVVFGEVKRWHPLVGFGFLANKVEGYVNRMTHRPLLQFLLGLFAWLILVISPTVVFIVFSTINFFGFVATTWLDIIVLYIAIGYTSLRQHALAVFDRLIDNNIDQARLQVSRIVSRDTEQLDKVGIRKATIESVLENGSDAIFAPIFWYVIGGAPAVIIYRLANTLDAMWGYKTSRFLYFGRFSARIDDVLNYLPSRLVGVSYLMLGHFKLALNCWWKQANLLDSPNAGVVMTSGAGALQIELGGDGYYHGQLKRKPSFGCGRAPQDKDIQRSLWLIDKTVFLWCFTILAVSLLYTDDYYSLFFL